jgi:hypothetical protein
MPLYPQATQDSINHNGSAVTGGTYTGGPFKIVHHTTEGSNYSGARSTYEETGNLPHFTIHEDKVYQHLDTSRSATALKNLSGGVQTNRDSAVQIEVVGFATRAKSDDTLASIAELCRWIERTHQVAREWPNGFPTPPGTSHNRNAIVWDQRSGHYGHCHVPENTHEDPGYTASEIQAIMGNDPLALLVQGNELPSGLAYLEDGTAWCAARSVVEALGGAVGAMSDGISVLITIHGSSAICRARAVASGTAFIPARELRRITGVQVSYLDGELSIDA